ncbi:RidA family protein [Pendulispora rubella]|uniref:RidA family protein n=1 Tax=Pendulispora rubella TaxID=2741070 RepID=A0ABZ2KZT6_9BACT
MTTKIHRNPDTIYKPVGNYSHAVEVQGPNRTLYISGTVPELPSGEVPRDFEGQCEATWNNILEILKSAGMGPEHLVKVNTYLTSRDQADANSRIRRRILGDARPALKVIVTQTIESDWLLEIEGIAVAPL